MRSLTLFVAVLILWPLTSHCADLDTIEAEVSSKWEKIQSMTYDMDSNVNNVGQGFSYLATSTGTAEMKRKDEKRWLMRMESKMNSTQTMAGKETKNVSTSLLIIDGDYMYSLNDTDGQKSATKMKSKDWNEMAGGKGFFKWLREHNDVKVLADETIDGVSCYVISATMKNNPAAAGALKYWFSKDNGMVVSTEASGPDGKVMSTSKIKNIKLSPSLADDRFVFVAPAGVVVQDMEAIMEAAKKSQADAEKAQAAAKAAEKTEAAEKKEDPKAEPKKEEAKKDEPKKDEDKPKKEEDKPKKKKSKVPGF